VVKRWHLKRVAVSVAPHMGCERFQLVERKVVAVQLELLRQKISVADTEPK
jgi:hypothetical protein